MMLTVAEEVIVNDDVREGTAVENTAVAQACPAIKACHLCKAYGETVAVGGVSFLVAEGEINHLRPRVTAQCARRACPPLRSRRPWRLAVIDRLSPAETTPVTRPGGLADRHLDARAAVHLQLPGAEPARATPKGVAMSAPLLLTSIRQAFRPARRQPQAGRRCAMTLIATTGGMTVHNHESDFRSPLRPEKVLEAFRELTAGKRWEITSEGAHRVRARSGPTLRGMGEDMDVSAEPDGEGSHVHVAVRSRMGALQLVDWGEARIFHREIVAWLRAWEGAEAGTGDR